MKKHYRKNYKYCDRPSCKFAHAPNEIELIHPLKKIANLED